MQARKFELYVFLAVDVPDFRISLGKNQLQEESHNRYDNRAVQCEAHLQMSISFVEVL